LLRGTAGLWVGFSVAAKTAPAEQIVAFDSRPIPPEAPQPVPKGIHHPRW
jgi:hypothetical protein